MGLWVRVVDGKSIWYNDSLISEIEYLRSFWVNFFFLLSILLRDECDCAKENYKRWRTERDEAFFFLFIKQLSQWLKQIPGGIAVLSAPKFLYHSSYYTNTRMARQYALQNTFQFGGWALNFWLPISDLDSQKKEGKKQEMSAGIKYFRALPKSPPSRKQTVSK